MARDTRRILEWLKRHGVGRRLRRFIGSIWTALRKLTAAVFGQVRRRPRFTSAVVISLVAALILVQIPWIGKLLAAIVIILGVIMGMIEEFTAAIHTA